MTSPFSNSPRPGTTVPSEEVLARLAAVVGPAYAITNKEQQAPHLSEWRERYVGATPMVLRPADTAQVAAILKIANETGTAIVPQGGNTGLVGAQIPFESGNEVVVCLGRLNKIRTVDPSTNTMTVEAGVILADAQAAAEEAGRLFPLSLGAEGSCQIGGNLSTNAGGTAVLAYGNARDLTLGLEVALADGRVWDGLRGLRKDNTGYDLKQLFIGAEGTLGIITAAVLKLFPKPRAVLTAFVGLQDPRAAVRLLHAAAAKAGGTLTSFELMQRIALDFVLKHLAGSRDPLNAVYPWYVLIEVAAFDEEAAVRPRFEALLAEALAEGIVGDAAIAASTAQAAGMWRLRAAMSEVQKHEGGSIKHDVSVPVGSVPEFLERADRRVAELIPEARVVAFGHLGDGNIHYNVSQPLGSDRQAFLARWEEVNAEVHGVVAALGGSISAEHGIGRMKRDLLPTVKSAVEMEMMGRIKAAFDPNGILNPNKLLRQDTH
jgi:FAD/FMN-containing dehydrogenase